MVLCWERELASSNGQNHHMTNSWQPSRHRARSSCLPVAPTVLCRSPAHPSGFLSAHHFVPKFEPQVDKKYGGPRIEPHGEVKDTRTLYLTSERKPLFCKILKGHTNSRAFRPLRVASPFSVS